MLFSLLAFLTIFNRATCHDGNNIPDTFVSILSTIEKLVAPPAAFNNPEISRWYANTWAVGLKCYDAAVKVPSKQNCPDFVHITLAYGLYHMVKQSADHVKLSVYLDEPMYNLLKSYNCDATGLNSARLLALQIAKELQCERFTDGFYSYYLPESPYSTIDPKLKANSTHKYAHYAYYKPICLEADPKTLFPLKEPPKIDDFTVIADWNEFYNYASDPQIIVDTAKRDFANFWVLGAVGGGIDTGATTAGLYLTIARQLINNNVNNDLRKVLQSYVLLMTAIANADSAAWKYMYHYNAYPTELMNYGYNGRPSLPHTSNWASIVSSVKDVYFPGMPTYPNADVAIAKSFAYVASQLFPNNPAVTVWSTDTTTNVERHIHFANADAMHDSFLNSMLYSGVGFRFGLNAGSDLGERVGKVTFNLLTKGQCTSQYAI